MIAPCSCGVNLPNEPLRRSGYQIPHGHAELSAARRGRRKSQSSRSVSKPEAYVRPNIVSSGFCESPAKGSALSTSRSPVTKKVGSSLIETSATPRGSLTSWYRTASSRLPSSARWSGLASRDRKSTRLNSSHLVISYAVFCLKKKKKTKKYYFFFKKKKKNTQKI